jgi:plasmid stabilization system protein ParE
VSRHSVSPEAQQDMDEIWDYISADSVDAAERWIERLLDGFRLIAANPGIGHCRGEWAAPEVRFWSIGNYLVIYRKKEHTENIGITRGARDVPRFLSSRLA